MSIRATKSGSIPAPIPIWSGPDSLAQIFLIEGDRGTGKTSALVQKLNQLLSEGVAPERIQILCGHRLYHRREFLRRLAEHLLFPLAPLPVYTFPQWLRHWLEACPDPLGQTPQLMTANDTLLLMQGFFQSQPGRFFQGHHLERSFFRHLLNRHRARAINAWSWPEFEQRSAALESEPLIPEIHAFLKAFQAWLLERESPLLDYPLQWEYLNRRLTEPGVQAWLGGFTHWLIDDLDETSPAEQRLISALSGTSAQLILTANPYGGAEQVLGAHPEYVQILRARAQIEALPDHHPQAALASRLYHLCLEQPLAESEKQVRSTFIRLKNSSAMLASLEMHLRKQLSAGVAPGELVLVSWALTDAFCLEVETLMARMGVPVEIYRGSRVIQRNPLVSVLLALLRLVYWETGSSVAVPRLNGFEMAQIFALCLHIPPFELARLRQRFQDRLGDWGQFLQEQQSPQAQRLRETVADVRGQLRAQAIPLSQAAIELWQRLLLPHLQTSAWGQVSGVTELIQRLTRWEQVSDAVEKPEALFLQALFSGEIREAGDPVQAPSEQAIKLMTLHRLCELHMASDYQFWLDLSHPGWTLQTTHPLNQRLIFSRSWPAEQPWSLEAEESAGERHLAKMLRKGLRYCRKEPLFFAADYDALSQRQSQQTLVRFLENPEVDLSQSAPSAK